MDRLLDPQQRVSCPGYDCPMANAPAAELRQHEADVTHWYPTALATSFTASASDEVVGLRSMPWAV